MQVLLLTEEFGFVLGSGLRWGKNNFLSFVTTNPPPMLCRSTAFTGLRDSNYYGTEHALRLIVNLLIYPLAWLGEC